MYQMVLASIEGKNIEEAEKYLKEYEELAPNDYSIYIFRYKNRQGKERAVSCPDRIPKEAKETAYMENGLMSWPSSITRREWRKNASRNARPYYLVWRGKICRESKNPKSIPPGEIDKEELLKA